MKHHHFKKTFQIISSIAVFTILIISSAKNTLPVNASVVANMHGAIWSFMPTDSDECIKGYNQGEPVPCGTNVGDGTNASSGQGLGWALMNSTPDDANSTVPYGVSLDSATGIFSGYAWSGDEGYNQGDLPGGFWVDFGPTDTPPTESGNLPVSARIEPTCFASTTTTTCPVIGWIRYIPGELTDQSITGGWDGWVSLKGASKVPPYNYGITYDKTDGTFTGDAWGSNVAGWVRFPKTISTVHVTALTCMDTSGVSYPYYPGQAIPAACTTVDLCSNLNGIQTTLPWQDPNTLVWYTHYPNDPVGICTKTTVLTCTDPTADNNGGPLPCTYPADYCTLHPSACTGSFCQLHPSLCTVTDLCQPPAANAAGNQTGPGPWQVGGVWYGLAGGFCKVSVCSNYPDATHTDTFYALPPAGEIALPDGTCGTATNWCASHPCNTTGGTIKPIYKEN